MAERLGVLVVHAVDPNPNPSTHTAVPASVAPVPPFGLLRTKHTGDCRQAGTLPQLHVYMKSCQCLFPICFPSSNKAAVLAD